MLGKKKKKTKRLKTQSIITLRKYYSMLVIYSTPKAFISKIAHQVD